MLNKAEKRILHGLYLRRPVVALWDHYTPAQINWLGANRYCRASAWARSESPPAHVIKSDMDSAEMSLLQLRMAGAALVHMEAAGLIQCSSEGIEGELFSVAVTYQGAELARKLSTPWGQLDLLYRDGKEGIPGVVVTIIVAAATAWLVTAIKSMPWK